MKCLVCETPATYASNSTRGCISLTRGLCGTCYRRVRSNGTLDAVALPPRGFTGRAEGDRARGAHGYVTVKTRDGIKMEHRVIMETHLGRPLAPGETVHHINGIRHDNGLENLELWASPQPYGQRVTDLISFVVKNHRQAVLEELAKDF